MACTRILEPARLFAALGGNDVLGRYDIGSQKDEVIGTGKRIGHKREFDLLRIRSACC